jgi:hypothetical protein
VAVLGKLGPRPRGVFQKPSYPRALGCGVALSGALAAANACGGAPSNYEERGYTTWSVADAATDHDCDSGAFCDPGSAGARGQDATGGQPGDGGGEPGSAGSEVGTGDAGGAGGGG